VRQARAADLEWDNRVAVNRAEPRQFRWMEVADGDERRARPQSNQQPLGHADFAASPRRAIRGAGDR
jgi:hypothetical protein